MENNQDIVFVKTAISFPSHLKADFETKIKSKYPNANVEYLVDPSILSGMITIYKDKELTWDLKSEVEFILENLIK